MLLVIKLAQKLYLVTIAHALTLVLPLPPWRPPLPVGFRRSAGRQGAVCARAGGGSGAWRQRLRRRAGGGGAVPGLGRIKTEPTGGFAQSKIRRGLMRGFKC